MNDVPYDVKSTLIDFEINGRVLGRVTRPVADRLVATGGGEGGGVFALSTGTNRMTLTLGHAAGNTFEGRTRSIGRVMEALRNGGYVDGWRDEMYPVGCDYDECRSAPYFLIERSCASILGIIEYGVHVNGIVLGDGGLATTTKTTTTGNNDANRMWLGRRSTTKSKYPGCVDHIAAGGLPYGISIRENAIKECSEEAGIPVELSSAHLRPAGAIWYENYERVVGRGRHEGVVNRVVLFCYDLTLPTDFVPRVVDGEVESFFTWSMEELCDSLDPSYGDPMKPNCYPGEEEMRNISWSNILASSPLFPLAQKLTVHVTLITSFAVIPVIQSLSIISYDRAISSRTLRVTSMCCTN
jgi:8-oxo-dGTP pyrophosphatase MutT (NUDIX family)